MKFNFNKLKVLGLSIFSLVFYFVLTNSEKVNSTLLKVQNSNSNKAFGIYITLHLLKWFLLIFGVISMVLIMYELVIKKKH